MAEIQYDDLFAGDVTQRVNEATKSIMAFEKAFEELIKTAKSAANGGLKNAAEDLKKISSSSPDATAKMAALEKEVEQLTIALKKFETESKKIPPATAAANQSIAAQTKVMKDAETQFKKLDPAAANYTKEVQRLGAEHKNAANSVTAMGTSLKKQTTAINKSQGDYGRMNAELIEARNTLRTTVGAIDEATGAWNRNIPAVQQALQTVSKLDPQLKKLDQQMGLSGRNVGNYRGALNGLSLSFNQLTREAPAFAVSANTGFLALSNNIPIFVDQLQNLNQMNKRLAADGQKTISVMKGLGTALFSMQTVLSIGVTLLTLYGGKLIKAAQEVFKLEKAFDALIEVQKASQDNTAKSVSEFDSLLFVLYDVESSQEQVTIALKKLNDEYPDLIDNIDDEDQALRDVTERSEEYRLELEKRAKAQAALNLISAEYVKLFQLQADLLAKDITKEQINQLKEFKEELGITGKASFEQLGQLEEKFKSTGQVVTLEFLTAMEEAEVSFIEQEKVLKKIGTFQEIYRDNITDTSKKLKDGEDDVDAYSHSLERLAGISTGLAEALQRAARLKPDQKSVNLFEEGVAKQVKTVEMAGVEIKESVDDTVGFWFKSWGDAQVWWDDWGDETVDVVMQTMSAVNDIIQKSAELRQEIIQQEIDSLNLRRDIEISNAGENADAKAAINLKFDKEQRRLNRELAEDKKKAAIIDSIISTAQAVGVALGSAPPPFNFIMAGIVGAAGAIQTGIIANQPIPAFAEGTDFAQGGKAMVGEIGSELVVTPSGDVGLTPSGPTIMDIPRGSRVIPADETAKIMNDSKRNLQDLMTTNQLLKAIEPDRPNFEGMFDKQTDSLKQAFQNQTNHITQVNKNGLEFLIQKGNNTTKILNHRYR